MSAQVISNDDALDFTNKTDREILEAIAKSQFRVEQLVTEVVNSARPAIEAFSKRGISGLMGAFGGR